jgi:purine-binding chemotaxis protein CheW
MSSEFPDGMPGLDLGGSTDEQDGGDDEEEIEHERLLVFEIGDREYAATVDAVRTVVEPEDMTRVPLSSAAIEGIMDLRGEIIAVINPRVHFGVGPSSMPSELERLVIFNRPPDRQPAGIRVDRVVGVEAFPAPLFYPLDEVESDAFRSHSDLIASVIQRFEDGEVTERIGVIDTEAMVDASGQVAAEPIS